jgi:alpha-beta hydrolase superfamily lysophospholipase
MNGSVFRISRWHDLGFNVLAVDYRGFGKSTEILPSEQTASEDARAAFDELVRRQPDPARRFVYGHSLGGALAVELASHLPADQLAGVIIESTFTSIPDLVRGMRWGWVPGIGLAVTQRFDTSERIAKVKAPLLILHGTADSVVPHTMADELYRLAGSQDKRVVKIEGGTHSGFRGSTTTYREAVAGFVQSSAGLSTVGATGATAIAD